MKKRKKKKKNPNAVLSPQNRTTSEMSMFSRGGRNSSNLHDVEDGEYHDDNDNYGDGDGEEKLQNEKEDMNLEYTQTF